MTAVYDGSLILDVINKGLDALGQSPKNAIWVFLEKDFKLNRNELPENIREFQEVLQKIFGMGYNFLDTLFCHYLEEATGKKFHKNQSFCERVECLLLEQSKLDNNEDCVAINNNEGLKVKAQRNLDSNTSLGGLNHFLKGKCYLGNISSLSMFGDE